MVTPFFGYGKTELKATKKGLHSPVNNTISDKRPKNKTPSRKYFHPQVWFIGQHLWFIRQRYPQPVENILDI